MPDDDVEIGTVSVPDLIKSIQNGKHNTSSDLFNTIVGDKIKDAIDQERVKIAGSIYNDVEDEDEEIEDDDVEEIEDDEEEEEEELDPEN